MVLGGIISMKGRSYSLVRVVSFFYFMSKNNKRKNRLMYREKLKYGKGRYKSKMRGKSFLNTGSSPVIIIQEGIKTKATIKRRLRQIFQRTSFKDLSYKEYLRTKYWKRIREKTLKRAKWKCERCHLGCFGLNVHHKFYRERGTEKMNDLICLCRICHEEEHGIRKKIPD